MTPEELRLLLLPRLEPQHREPILTGRPVFPGRVWGPLTRERPRAGSVFMARRLTCDDLEELLGCVGLVLRGPFGEMISQGWEIPSMSVEADVELAEGEPVMLDAACGRLYQGEPLVFPEEGLSPDLAALLERADARARMQVLASADSAAEWLLGRRYGAAGVGLCRLERVLNGADAGVLASRLRGLYRAAAGRPITVRLLDPSPIGERNPTLGLRWCRWGLLHPEVYEAHLEAVFAAAEATGSAVNLLVPGPCLVTEFVAVQRLVQRQAGPRSYRLGAMLELPGACLLAGELACLADFLCFGTNDLTQAVLGMSREDARFELIPDYLDRGLLERDPFRYLDPGVLELMGLAVRAARRARRDLPIGVCGDHAGVPANTAALERLGLDWVTCYPRQVPLVRLAAGGESSKSNP